MSKIDMIMKDIKYHAEISKKVYGKWKENRFDQILTSALTMELFQVVNYTIELAELFLAKTPSQYASTYFEVFESMRRIGVIDDRDLKIMINAVGFRNMVAHRYHALDEEILERVYKDLNHILKVAEKIKEKLTKTK
ncbi:MAG: HepT-like ribonuclease domain-containing protein [Candidatus Anstonellales archaeon]